MKGSVIIFRIINDNQGTDNMAETVIMAQPLIKDTFGSGKI